MLKMIIVEDEHYIRNWLKNVLSYSEIGIEIVGVASNGLEGVELIKNYEPDIVLTDITMPVMDAFLMFDCTKQFEYKKIIISGYSDFINAKMAIKYGVSDFLTKPLDINELEMCLKQIIISLISDNNVQLNIREDRLDSHRNIILKIINWINQNYKRQFTISELSTELGFSESYLYRIFKNQLKMTISEYLNNFRILKSIELMITVPEFLVYEISESVGFSDYKYFSKIFKNITGMTPSEFKKSTNQKEIFDSFYHLWNLSNLMK